MSANNHQVGGNHYKKHGDTGEQHWDRQYRLFGPGYFIGCATKYIERYRDKNGKQDLQKAIHFIQKLMELEYPDVKAATYAPDLRTELQRQRDFSKMIAQSSHADGSEPGPGYVNQD